MGCKSSKVATTAEEIVTKGREIRFAIKWLNKKFKGQKHSDTRKDMVLFARTLSAMGGDETPLYFRTEDSLLEVQSISSSECLSNVQVDNSISVNTPSTPRKMLKTSSPEGSKSTEGDLSTNDLDDDVSLTDHWSSIGSPFPLTRARSTLTTEKMTKPKTLHNAWSHESMQKTSSRPARNNMKVLDAKPQTLFPGYLEEPDDDSLIPNSRHRPKAAKGCRQAPDLSQVYQAELSIPGTPMEDPIRQLEKRCLEAWMERCLGDCPK